MNYENILADNDSPRELFAFMSDFDGFFNRDRGRSLFVRDVTSKCIAAVQISKRAPCIPNALMEAEVNAKTGQGRESTTLTEQTVGLGAVAPS